jgi:hypothetical protein
MDIPTTITMIDDATFCQRLKVTDIFMASSH